MKKVQSFALFLLVSVFSISAFAQTSDIAKLTKKVAKQKSLPVKKLTGGAAFEVPNDVDFEGCASTFSGLPADVQNQVISSTVYLKSEFADPSLIPEETCASQTVANCQGSGKYCIIIFVSSTLVPDATNTRWVPGPNSQILECCQRAPRSLAK